MTNLSKEMNPSHHYIQRYLHKVDFDVTLRFTREYYNGGTCYYLGIFGKNVENAETIRQMLIETQILFKKEHNDIIYIGLTPFGMEWIECILNELL